MSKVGLKRTYCKECNQLKYIPDDGHTDTCLECLTKEKTKMNEEDVIEEMIQEKGLTAPRLTPQMIKDTIVNGQHVYPEGTTLTICILTLKNGFTVTGESNCASPENYNKEIGDKIAMDNAIEKIWPLEGYLLKQRLYERTKIEDILEGEEETHG